MKKDSKKALYESIMASVAKEVKKALNEENESLFVYCNDYCDDGDTYPIEMLMKDAAYHNCKFELDPSGVGGGWPEIKIIGKYKDVKWLVKKYYCAGEDDEFEYDNIVPFN